MSTIEIFKNARKNVYANIKKTITGDSSYYDAVLSNELALIDSIGVLLGTVKNPNDRFIIESLIVNYVNTDNINQCYSTIKNRVDESNKLYEEAETKRLTAETEAMKKKLEEENRVLEEKQAEQTNNSANDNLTPTSTTTSSTDNKPTKKPISDVEIINDFTFKIDANESLNPSNCKGWGVNDVEKQPYNDLRELFGEHIKENDEIDHLKDKVLDACVNLLVQ